jgi:hypothetical protein
MYFIPVYLRKKIIALLLERNDKILKEKQKAAGYKDV